jgi:hypothetical protein
MPDATPIDLDLSVSDETTVDDPLADIVAHLEQLLPQLAGDVRSKVADLLSELQNTSAVAESRGQSRRKRLVESAEPFQEIREQLSEIARLQREAEQSTGLERRRLLARADVNLRSLDRRMNKTEMDLYIEPATRASATSCTLSEGVVSPDDISRHFASLAN